MPKVRKIVPALQRRYSAAVREYVARPDERPKEGPLTGHTYVITGTLESMSREQAGAALEELGAKVTSSVSAKTTALIAGEEPGNSKLTKAQKVGTRIFGEAEFLELLETK